MGRINVEAGDFKKGKHSQFLSTFGANIFQLATNDMGWTGYKTVDYKASDVQEVELASEDSVKRLGGTVGWGVAGAALLGPVGLLAGLLAGGRGRNVTFVCLFKDGKKFLGTTDSKTYKKIVASQF